MLMPPLQSGIGLEQALAVKASFFGAHLYFVALVGVDPKPLCSHPVEQPEVDRLGQLSIVLADLIPTSKPLGGKGVEIPAFGKSREHLLIAGDLGRDPQLYLRVVSDDEDAALGRTDVASKGTTSGDVLQVGVVAGHPSCGCPQLA